MNGPINLNDGWLSPIHNSANGVHADFNTFDGQKYHVPYQGQTTLDMFSKPSYDTYNTISQNGLGTLRHDKAF
jgi:hypothetical protein